MNNKESPEKAINLSQALLTAIRKVLRPLVRLLLNFRISFPQLAEILKSVYVETATDEFKLPNKKQTDTRLSLLTGIHRKDIKRLRNQAGTDNKTPKSIDLTTRIIARWLAEKRYLDKNKQPLKLPLQADKNKPSFESLVQDVCKRDIHQRVVLDEWLHRGVVSLDDDKNLTLNTDAFVPNKSFDEKAFFLGHNISDHFTAATHNLLNKQPPFFDRCVYYDSLSQESIQELQEIAAAQGMKMLININERAMALRARDAARTDNNQRINIGLYSYHESETK